MANLTKEQYEKEKHAIKKLVSKEEMELRSGILAKIKKLEAYIEKKPEEAKKKMFSLHKKLVGVEERLRMMLSPRKIKKTSSKKVEAVARKAVTKQKKTKRLREKRKK